MTILTATITTVKLGHIEFEGLLFDDKTFGIAVPQIAMMFPYFEPHKNYEAQALKRLMGASFKTHKFKSPFNNNATSGISLNDFERVLLKLDRVGDKKAQEMRDDLVGMSLHQLWSDAFNIVFEKEDRQLWMKNRQDHRKQFHPLLTSWLKADVGGDSKSVNWGKEINIFKIHAKLPTTSVDEYDADQLHLLNNAKIAYNALRKVGIDHRTALKSL
jgi:hypothetical protein